MASNSRMHDASEPRSTNTSRRHAPRPGGAAGSSGSSALESLVAFQVAVPPAVRQPGMGAQQSSPSYSGGCCSSDSGGSRPLGPMVTERLYGPTALLVAAVRVQCAARRWLALRCVRDTRRRSVDQLRAKRRTLHEQLTSTLGRFAAELQQNANLQAVVRAQLAQGPVALGMPVVVGERDDERGLRQKVQEKALLLAGRRPVNISGVWYAIGDQGGVPLEETFLLMQDETAVPLDPEALRDELRSLDSPEACFQFARACGVPHGPLQAARDAQHPRTSAIGLCLDHLRRKPFEATFRGACRGDDDEPFVIRRGRVMRSESGDVSVDFTQRYSDGEEVIWHAKVEGRGDQTSLEQGRWSGIGQQSGGFSARRVGDGDEARWSDAGVLQLRSRALCVGVSLAAVMRALKTHDPEGALRSLITAEASGLPSNAGAREAVLRRSLEAERLSELTVRAEDWGSFGQVETALDSARPKKALVDLLLSVAGTSIPEGTESAETAAALAAANRPNVMGLWSPEQVDPWWALELPLAASGRSWFRKPDRSYIQLTETERKMVLRCLSVRLGSNAAPVNAEWQRGSDGGPLEVYPEREAERRVLLAGRGLCWSAEDMTGASQVPLVSREVARENSAEAGGLLGTGLDISAGWSNLLTVATGVRRWGLHGLAAERVATLAEVDALESDSQLLRRRWKWWREQNGYLQQAQGVAMGHITEPDEPERSVSILDEVVDWAFENIAGEETVAERRRDLAEQEASTFFEVDDAMTGSSWVGDGGDRDSQITLGEVEYSVFNDRSVMIDSVGRRSGGGHVSSGASASVSQRMTKGIGGLVGGLRAVETRDAARLAGVWHAVKRQSSSYSAGGGEYVPRWYHSADGSEEGELFVLEVGVTGAVTGRPLSFSGAGRSPLRRGGGSDPESFELINVRLEDGDRVRMTQVFGDGTEMEWRATLFSREQMVDGEWSNESGWSARFTASKLPMDEAEALLGTGQSVGTAVSLQQRRHYG